MNGRRIILLAAVILSCLSCTRIVDKGYIGILRYDNASTHEICVRLDRSGYSVTGATVYEAAEIRMAPGEAREFHLSSEGEPFSFVGAVYQLTVIFDGVYSAVHRIDAVSPGNVNNLCLEESYRRAADGKTYSYVFSDADYDAALAIYPKYR